MNTRHTAITISLPINQWETIIKFLRTSPHNTTDEGDTDPRTLTRIANQIEHQLTTDEQKRVMALPGREGRIWLDVAYEDKDDAKAHGARWDPEARLWYNAGGSDYNRRHYAMDWQKRQQRLDEDEDDFEFERYAREAIIESLTEYA